MGADLSSIVKTQKLTDNHIQFLVYQILRGLKVSVCLCSFSPASSKFVSNLRHHSLLFPVLQYIHSAGVIHRVIEVLSSLSCYILGAILFQEISLATCWRLSTFSHCSWRILLSIGSEARQYRRQWGLRAAHFGLWSGSSSTRRNDR